MEALDTQNKVNPPQKNTKYASLKGSKKSGKAIRIVGESKGSLCRHIPKLGHFSGLFPYSNTFVPNIRHTLVIATFVLRHCLLNLKDGRLSIL